MDPVDLDNANDNHIDLVENTETLKCENDLTGYVDIIDVDNTDENYIDLIENMGL